MKSDSKTTGILLETQYLPRVSAFVMMKSFSQIIIESNEYFQKSTLRNRCTIIGANGPILLTIPIYGGRGLKQLVKDVRIANDDPWQRVHWGSLFSSYGKSSFFVFYKDTFISFYQKRFEFLLDFNCALLEECFRILNIKAEIFKSGPGINEPAKEVYDARNKILDSEGLQRYHQVFEDRHGFVHDLSIIDLLFNTGPQARSIIFESIISEREDRK